MKGMLDFLEKAGLVKKDAPEEPAAPPPADTGPASPVSDMAAPPPPPGNGTPLNLDEIYANAGIAPSLYPAERLLRLLDGLSAMDEATRRMAIQAMDAADESWSIEDPLSDAAAKARALAAHAEHLQQNLQALQVESQQQCAAIAARQDKVVGDIRKQISELEALVSRELNRAAQETAAQESQIQDAQDQTARELSDIAQTRQRLLGLAAQFGTPVPPTQE